MKLMDEGRDVGLDGFVLLGRVARPQAILRWVSDRDADVLL